MIEIKRVTTPGQLSRFLRLPRQVYANDPLWVPHLTLQTLLLMGSPWGRDRGFWLAYEDGLPVARIGAKIHHAHGRETLHFGFFECVEGHGEAAARLVETAHELAPELDMVGPYQFRMEDPYTGLLVEGFEHAPCFWAAYNPPYYKEYLEKASLTKIMDLWTYRCDWQSVRLKPIYRRANLAAESGITVRTIDVRRRWREINEVAKVMNHSLQENWGFEEFTTGQILELYLLSYLFLDPGWLFLAENQGETVGAAIVLPDYNPWIKASGGRLTIRLLRRLLWKEGERIEHIRAWGIGVLPDERSRFTAPALLAAGIDRCKDREVESADLSWILENNDSMNAMLRGIGAYRSKVHRVLSRPGSKSRSNSARRSE